MMTIVGQMLGQYRIEEKLGEGGMGVVYRAHDTKLERDVALKLLTESPTSPETRKRLLAEARAASGLNHPNVATIYEVGEADDHNFIVMELVPGRPLSKSIPVGGLPVETCLRYGQQIASALMHAHERGVIHRDLKDANVVITPEGQAKVLDFGLARSTRQQELSKATRSQDSLETSNSLAGTLHFMAPELLRGEEADARSDIWALGVLLYEMAAGTLPFGGRTGYELTSVILRETPDPLPARVPPGVRGVIQRCLTKDPGHRYSSAAQVHAALEAISSDTAVAPAVAAAVAATVSSRSSPWWKSTAGIATVALLAIVGLAVGLAGWKGIRLRRTGATVTAPTVARVSTGGRASANAEANEAFERGGLFLKTRLDLARARQQFERALELDPKFATARAYRGFGYLQLIHLGMSNDRSLLYKAEEELRQALKDEPDLGVGHGFLGGIFLYQGRKEMAVEEAQKAVSPETGIRFRAGGIWLSSFDYLSGDYPGATQKLQEIMQLDPLFWPAHWMMSQILIEEEKVNKARVEGQKVLDQDPGNLLATVTLGYGQMIAGDVQGARAWLEKTRPEDKENYRLRLVWALVNAREGKQRGPQDKEVLTYAEVNPFVTLSAAEYYALEGDATSALDWLDRAVRGGDERMEWFKRDPLLASIRNHPRFKQILDSIAFRRQQRGH